MLRFLLISGMLSVLVSCSGQSPASIKNSTTSKNPVSTECKNLTFEGNVFNQKNILNILGCTGWSKQYPALTTAVKNAKTSEINKFLSVFNESFTSTKSQRREFFKFLVTAQDAGQLDEVSKLLERSIGDHKLMQQLTKVLESHLLDEPKRAAFMKVLSVSNSENLGVVTASKNLMTAFEGQKDILDTIFTNFEDADLRKKLIIVLDELSIKMADDDWRQVSKIIQEEDSSLQKWAIRGTRGDARPLLDVIEDPNFVRDIKFLQNSIANGIRCGNRADAGDFKIDVAQELKHKIASLSQDPKEEVEKVLLHGLSKFIAFNEFCEEKNQRQGLESFHAILTHAFRILGSQHDYLFLRDIHNDFGADRFKLISFLSSATFEQLRDQLINLKEDSLDQDLVKSLYSLISGLSEKDLSAVSKLTKSFGEQDSQARNWIGAWSDLWKGLAFEDKDEFIHLLSAIAEKDIEMSKAMGALESLMIKFPHFSERFAQNLATNDYQTGTRYVISVLSKPEVQNELSRFLSGQGLFQFLELLTREERRSVVSVPEVVIEPAPVTYVETPSPSRESQLTHQCFEILSLGYKKNVNYYSIVNGLPEACLSILGDVGFVGQIYLWMNASNSYFSENYGVSDFHAGTGVWAPGMLQFIFTAAFKADRILSNGHGKVGIRANIDEIHRVTTHPFVLETINKFSTLYGVLHNTVNLDSNILLFINNQPDHELNSLASDAFTLMETSPARIDLTIKPVGCHELSTNFGANPCLSEKETLDHVINLARIAKRKNSDGNSLLQELMKWIHPQGGIPMPFRKKTTSTHQTSLDEITRFLMDLSSPKTNKKFVISNGKRQKTVQGTVLDRLEVLIRDISFTNNFYGAFFKNKVGSADNYRKEVISSEKLLALLVGGGGTFRGTNTLPDESKWLLKNVQETYSSLVEVSDNYKQPDGSSRSYGPFIQSLLTLIGESSSKSTQDFNAYRVPKQSLVDGHNGVFLTETVKMSALRHLGGFVRSRFGDDLSVLNSADFKLINSRLLARHDLSILQSGLQSLLDNYLDNDRNQLNTMLEDLIVFSKSLDESEQEVFEEIAVKTLLLLSDEKISNHSIQEVASMLELIVQSWPELREVITAIGNRTELLESVNKLLDTLLKNPESLERLSRKILSSKIMSRDDFRKLVNNPKLRMEMTSFMKHALSGSNVNSTLNWSETLKAICGSDSSQWEAIKGFFQSALGQDRSKLTISLLIEFLGEKDQEGFRFKRIMDELFLNHRTKLLQFLDETFPSLQVNEEQR